MFGHTFSNPFLDFSGERRRFCTWSQLHLGDDVCPVWGKQESRVRIHLLGVDLEAWCGGTNLGNSVASSSEYTLITAAPTIFRWCTNRASGSPGGTDKAERCRVKIHHYPRTPGGTLVTLGQMVSIHELESLSEGFLEIRVPCIYITNSLILAAVR